MWRIANCVYRAFRNTATHRCSQDVLIPLTTICTTDDDDDDSKKKEKEKCSGVSKSDLVVQVLKNNQFTYQNIDKLQEYLRNISIQQVTKKANVLKSSKPKSVVNEVQTISPPNHTEETLDSLLKTDEISLNTMKNLSDLHEETLSIVNLQLALDALESGDYQFGIETLQTCAENGTNAAALYNLGICYERGIGVEQDRAKVINLISNSNTREFLQACDYYRQASTLGHNNAQFNLTLLSNHIDIHEDDDDDESTEQTTTNKQTSFLRELFFRFTLSNDYKEEQSFDDYQFDFKNQSIACLT